MQCSNRVTQIEKDIFSTIGQMSRQAGAINLGQGFPDWGPPEFLRQSLKNAADQDLHQYTPVGGLQCLRQNIAKRYKNILKQEIDPEKNVIVGTGSNGVIYDFFVALLNQGDEVLLFEPFFPIHIQQILITGGVPKYVELSQPKEPSGSWTIDYDALEKAFTDKTKILILNSPHNPTGKLFSYEEYEKIAEIVKKFPKVTVLSDEAYEHAIFDKQYFHRFTDMPGMSERTVTTISFGKMFSCVGWRLGVGIGPDDLIKNMKISSGTNIYCPDITTQLAYSNALQQAEQPYENSESYFKNQSEIFEESRNICNQIFVNSTLKLKTLNGEGGFFTCIDITDEIPNVPKKYFYNKEVENGDKPINCKLQELEDIEVPADYALIKHFIIDQKVTCMPMSCFYNNTNKKPQHYKGTNLIRIKTCTKPETIKKAFAKFQQ